jgi:hypothetical protein
MTNEVFIHCVLQGISCSSCCVTMNVRVGVRLVHRSRMVHTYIHCICSYVGLIPLSALQVTSFVILAVFFVRIGRLEARRAVSRSAKGRLLFGGIVVYEYVLDLCSL